MEKMQKICLKLIALAGILIFGYLTVVAWISSARIYAFSETIVWSGDRIWKNLLFIACALLICAGISGLADRISDRTLQTAAVAVSMAVAIGCGILVRAARSYPSADQIYVYEAAVNHFTGDYTNIQTEWYFNACPYQLGLGLVYGILMRVFDSSSYFVLQYAQAVCAGVTVYVSYALARELFSCKKAAAIVLLCSVSFVPVYLYALYIYGEAFGVCFAMLGLLFWLYANNGKDRKKKVTALYWGLTGICLALCYTVRLALVIVLIAILVTGLLKSLADKCTNRKGWWKCSILTVLLLFLALGSQKLSVSYMERQAGVELADGIPAILTVAMGIQDDIENGTEPGSYNAYNLWLYFEKGFDGQTASEEALLDIKRTLYRWSRNPVSMIRYLNRKVLNQWNEASYSAFCMTALQQEPEEWVNELYLGEAGDKWYDFLNMYQGMAYAMLLIYFVMLFKGRGHIFIFLPAIFLVGEFCFSMIWEAKSRYVYPYIVMALPCVAWSLSCCAGKMTEGIKKSGQKFLTFRQGGWT